MREISVTWQETAIYRANIVVDDVATLEELGLDGMTSSTGIEEWMILLDGQDPNWPLTACEELVDREVIGVEELAEEADPVEVLEE